MKTQNAYKTPKQAVLALGVILPLIGGVANAGNLNFNWAASTSTNVGGYKLFYGKSTNNYTNSVDVGNNTTYQLAGLTDGATYFFAVKAYNAAKTVESSFSNEVSATVAAPVAMAADFTASKTSGVAPLVVNFNASATTAVTSWQWNFGDASIPAANGQNATVTFAKPGTYTVSLVVNGSTTTTKAGFITVTAPVVDPGTGGGVPVDPGQNSNPADATNLVAAYSFDEYGWNYAVDASGKANHGVGMGGAARNAQGKFGQALSLDGVNDVIAIKDSASLNLANGYTLEAWVKPSVISRASVLAKGQAGGNTYSLYAAEDADVPAAGFNDGANNNVVAGNQALVANQWTHLASTYDGAFQRLYVNGVEVASVARQGAVKASAESLKIGGNTAFGEYFNGLIDEVRVYNRALAPAQIAKDMTTAISVANPSQMVVGNNNMEAVTDYNPQGVAEAYKTVAESDNMLTAVQVYLDAGSTATELVAGIYADHNGHPGALLGQGKKVNPKAGVTNTVKVPTVKIAANKPYWVAILGSKGVIKFRIRQGAVAAPIEASQSSTLTSLPAQWVSGNVYPTGGPISAYGSGY